MESIKWHSFAIVFSFVLLLVLGTFVYSYVEGWSYIDSSYFMVITATTIGYGDIYPTTNLGKIITMIYSVIGMAFVFYVISLISHRIFDKKIQLTMTDVAPSKSLVRKTKNTKKR